MQVRIERGLHIGHGDALARYGTCAPRATVPRFGAPTGAPLLGDIDQSPSRSGKCLRNYQVDAAEWLRANPHGLLGDEVGLGKTAQVLRALPPNARAIVVCPAYLRLVWRDECADWRPDLRATLGNEFRAPAPGELLIYSYESLPAPPLGAKRALAPACNLRGVIPIFDEAHYAKNPKAQRTKRVKLLVAQCGRAWPLTGTPLLGSPPDLRGVLFTFGLFDRAYQNVQNFDRVFSARKKQVKRNLSITEYGEALPEAREGLARVMLRRLKRDHLDLPPVIHSTIKVEAPDDLREELSAALDAWDAWGDPSELPPFELLSAALAALAKARIPAAVQHVKEALREGPLLVFSAYRAPVEALRSLPRVAVVTGGEPAELRKETADLFQAGAYDCVAGTIQAMGTGLTLTRASRVLMIDEAYTPALNEQAIGRAVRFGQTQSVLVERMISDHPLDVRRAEILARKTELIGKVVGT